MITENMQNMMSAELYNTLGKAPTPSNLESNNKNMNLELNSYNVNYGDNDLINDYYKKMLPNMDNNRVTVNPQNRQYYQQYRDKLYSQGSSDSSQDILMKKLNYMITLLEEQQDEKTSNVTEEVVLYSFLGVFIIFVVDSFARAGKYVR